MPTVLYGVSDFFLFTVCGNPVPYRILHDQHTDLLELIAKLLNIKADDTITHINVGTMIKEMYKLMTTKPTEGA